MFEDLILCFLLPSLLFNVLRQLQGVKCNYKYSSLSGKELPITVLQT